MFHQRFCFFVFFYLSLFDMIMTCYTKGPTHTRWRIYRTLLYSPHHVFGATDVTSLFFFFFIFGWRKASTQKETQLKKITELTNGGNAKLQTTWPLEYCFCLNTEHKTLWDVTKLFQLWLKLDKDFETWGFSNCPTGACGSSHRHFD